MVLSSVLKFTWIFLIICSVVTAGRIRQRPFKLVIDHDGGADDAMAIFIALLYEKDFNGPKVVGISTVNGNVNETQAFINTQRILEVAGRRDIPIYRGASSALVISHPTDEYFGVDGLGDLPEVSYKAIKAQSLHAALGLIELSKKYEDELVVVTIGTLTNIALAVKLDPDFIGRLKHIYVGAGNLYDEDFPLSTQPEFNVQLDVEAYRVVTDNSVPDKVTVVPFSQIRKHFAIPTEWRVNVLGTIPTRIMEAMNDFERVNIPKSDSWEMLDPAVMAIALESDHVDELKLTENSVILCGDAGGSDKDQRGTVTNEFKTSNPNMKLVYSAYKSMYQSFLIKVFSE